MSACKEVVPVKKYLLYSLVIALGCGLSPSEAQTLLPIDANPNQELADQVALQIKRTGLASGARIEVSAKNGVVELGGSVVNAQQAELIIKEITKMPGVKKVDTSLRLLPKSSNQRTAFDDQNDGPQQAQATGIPSSLAGPNSGGYPQGMPQGGTPQGYPRGGPPQGYPQGGPPQGYPQGGPPQGYPQGGPPQGYPQGGPPQGAMAHGGQPQDGYPQGGYPTGPMPMGGMPGPGGGTGYPQDPVPLAMPSNPSYDLTGPKMPPYAWPTYAPYPNYSRVAYPTAYPYNAFPFIGPFYPFPKVPLGWRSVKLEWDDGHWYLGRLSTPHDYWRVKFW